MQSYTKTGLFLLYTTYEFINSVQLLFTAISLTFGDPASTGGSTSAVAAEFLILGRFLLRRLNSYEDKTPASKPDEIFLHLNPAVNSNSLQKQNYLL